MAGDLSSAAKGLQILNERLPLSNFKLRKITDVGAMPT